MADVTCPKCGTVISLAQSEIDAVVRQVRDEEFERELRERLKAAEADKRRAVQLAEEKLRSQQLEEAARKDAKHAEEAARKDAKAAEEASRKDALIAQLQAQLAAQAETAAVQQKLAVSEAVGALEKERDELRASVQLKESERVAQEAGYKEKLLEQEQLRQQMLELKDAEIERLKDMRARLSTKMLGETLEIHCMNEFNRVRAMAFPHAYFERDTEAVEGTKGDFVYRECDEDGNEIISIMFEMKNESDTDSRKLRNEDHFAKLDRDRTKKGCEFAVLVSLLEPDSDLYNNGIVDVSHRYPKMYVVRPQFFLAIISLLRQGALAAMQYKREIALMRQQELDITTFESDLESFKEGFFRSFKHAADRYEDAIEGIDKTIRLLEKIRENLTKSESHLTAANNKLEDLTVKKLTRKNPTMREKFEALEVAAEEWQDDESSDD